MSEKKKIETLVVRIEKEVKEQLKEIAEERDFPLSYLVREAVKKFLKEKENGNMEI